MQRVAAVLRDELIGRPVNLDTPLVNAIGISPDDRAKKTGVLGIV